MRIAVLWSNISGYMSACWRALADDSQVDLKVWAYAPRRTGTQAPFDEQRLSAGLNLRLLDEAERHDDALVRREVADFAPQAMLVGGWANPAYVRVVSDPRFAQARKVMGIDLPWQGTARQRVACLLKRSYVRRFDYVWAAGERAFQYGRRLADSDDRVRQGVYAYDDKVMEPIARQRPTDGENWPRRILYVGRYAPEKGLDTLLDAYRIYRQQSELPWELHCCGTGPLRPMLADQPGVVDHGFVQPADLPEHFSRAGLFVLASRYEPWGVVVAEAMGSGLPAIVSTACGAGVELVHDHHGGWRFPTGNAAALSRRLSLATADPARLAAMSPHARGSAAAYAAPRWANRLLDMLRDPLLPLTEHPSS